MFIIRELVTGILNYKKPSHWISFSLLFLFKFEVFFDVSYFHESPKPGYRDSRK
jgi:hypothetical protein